MGEGKENERESRGIGERVRDRGESTRIGKRLEKGSTAGKGERGRWGEGEVLVGRGELRQVEEGEGRECERAQEHQ